MPWCGVPSVTILLMQSAACRLERRVACTCTASRTISPPIECAMMLTGGFGSPRLHHRQVADEVDEPHERLAVHLEAPVVEVVVAEHPQALARVLWRVHQLERRAGVDEHPVPVK